MDKALKYGLIITGILFLLSFLVPTSIVDDQVTIDTLFSTYWWILLVIYGIGMLICEIYIIKKESNRTFFDFIKNNLKFGLVLGFGIGVVSWCFILITMITYLIKTHIPFSVWFLVVVLVILVIKYLIYKFLIKNKRN